MGRVKRAYNYRCYPTDEQQQMLARTFGCARWVYNWALALKSRAYQEEGKRLSYDDLSACLPALKQHEETAWLAEVSSVPLQQSLRHLERAFVNFFEGRARYPRFKSKKRDDQAATYTATAFTWLDGTLTLAKMDAPLAIRWSRPLPEGAVPSTVTVRRDSAGRYFVSLLVEEEIEPLPISTEQVGVDLGLTSLVTTSRGDKVGNPRFFAADEKKLAKAIADVGWGEFVRQLEYKAQWYGRRLIKIDRWFPSSKTCSCCGYVLEGLDLEIREWQCPKCVARHDRDVNAAKSVLTEGLRLSAAGLAVRLPVEAT